MSIVIEQDPKSERRGLPSASMRMFGWEKWHVSQENRRVNPTYTSQISMNYSIIVQVIESTGDPN